MYNSKKILFGFIIFLLINFSSKAQQKNSSVKVIGEMKNVMWKGELQGNINLDTIADNSNLYGLGPVEYLTGEVLIIEGKAYQATVVSNTEMKVEETYKIKAPFFGYSAIAEWEERILPDNIQTISDLESYLDKITKSAVRPFMFKLSGKVKKAKIHIVNLPENTKVSSPKEAHEGQVDYFLKDEKVDIVGFFSTEHQTIFTHHNTFLHMHLITKNRLKMGHLDEVLFKKGKIKLYLPVE